eukprot:2046554-Prymnesium_polylepis.1
MCGRSTEVSAPILHGGVRAAQSISIVEKLREADQRRRQEAGRAGAVRAADAPLGDLVLPAKMPARRERTVAHLLGTRCVSSSSCGGG